MHVVYVVLPDTGRFVQVHRVIVRGCPAAFEAWTMDSRAALGRMQSHLVDLFGQVEQEITATENLVQGLGPSCQVRIAFYIAMSCSAQPHTWEECPILGASSTPEA